MVVQPVWPGALQPLVVMMRLAGFKVRPMFTSDGELRVVGSRGEIAAVPQFDAAGVRSWHPTHVQVTVRRTSILGTQSYAKFEIAVTSLAEVSAALVNIGLAELPK